MILGHKDLSDKKRKNISNKNSVEAGFNSPENRDDSIIISMQEIDLFQNEHFDKKDEEE